MSMRAQLSAIRGAGMIPAVSWHFADFVARTTGVHQERLYLTAVLASRAVEQSHVCVDLPALCDSTAGQFPEYDPDRIAAAKAAGIELPSMALPAIDEWLATLRSDSCRAAICGPADYLSAPRPLVVDEAGRIYLHRYFSLEQQLAKSLRQLAMTPPLRQCNADAATLKSVLAELFPAPNPPRAEWTTNWPKVAGFAALHNALTIVTGGPGTGKTTVVGRLLALLEKTCDTNEQPLRVALAAPTGKAAARLGEALKQQTRELQQQGVDLSRLELQTSTIHRLLGYRRHSIHFRRNAENPLTADVLVVDEASMVPLPLMTRVVDAVAPGARVLLLGDMHQLASVESGYVLGDLCEAAGVQSFGSSFRRRLAAVATGPQDAVPSPDSDATALADNCIPLAYSWRFPPGSCIDRVSRAVNAGDGPRALTAAVSHPTWSAPGVLLPATRELREPGVFWKSVPARLTTANGLPDPLFWQQGLLHRRYRTFLESCDPAAALDAFASFRVLCATRGGPHGVTKLNELIESVLALDYVGERSAERQRLADTYDVRASLPQRREQFYDHRPILITENNYALGLFNGDTGVIMRNPEAASEQLLAYFPASQPDRELRVFAPEMLPAHETAFAMTIHKSQGSQFDDVLVVLPHRDNPVLGRELVYTGVTRAAKRVELWLHPHTFHTAVARHTNRHSGLADALRQ